MSEVTWKDVAAAYSGSWPGRMVPEDFALMIRELEAREIAPVDVLAVIREHRGEHPPGAALIAASIDIERQGPPPGFMRMAGILAERITLLPYHEPVAGWEEFVRVVSLEHEAVGRFAVAVGVRGVREMPDPARVQEAGGSVELTRLEREYRAISSGWRADPRRGAALEEAGRQALVGQGGSMADVVEALRPAAQLTEGGSE